MESLKVLIVDDERSIRVGLQKLIDWSGLGYEITGFADNGLQALEQMERGSADIVITDIRMPVMDGLELVRRLRPVCDAEFLILSGHSEFLYAQKALRYGVTHYLLKPIHELELEQALEDVRSRILKKRNSDDLLEQGKSLLTEKSVEELLFYDLGQEELEELAGRLQLQDKRHRICVAALRVFVDGRHSAQSRTISGNLLKLIGEEARSAGARGVRIHTVYKNDLFFFLCDCPAAFSHLVSPFFEDLSGYFRSVRMDHVISLGPMVDKPERIAASKERALCGIELSYFKGINRVILPAETEGDQSAASIPDWNEQPLLDAVRMKNTADVAAEADRMFDTLSSGCASRRTVQAIAVNVIFKLNQLLGDNGSSLSHLFGALDYQQEIRQTHTAAGLHGWFSSFCVKVAEHLAALHDTHGYSVVLQVQAIIDRDYSRELHLKDIAEQLFFSPDYLGRLFKSAFGASFNDYLNQKRIDSAKKLLTGTGMSVYQVAAAVGFQNPDYFTRLFKKLEGITPNSYRRMEEPEPAEKQIGGANTNLPLKCE